MDFSLFYFSNYQVEQDNKYHLLLETVKFADNAGFKGIWTPERHFHEFGGLFPNPSVISAALAMITEQVDLRSGSIVSPLHDDIRIAEEWSVVDNLSNGRVSLSFASGWNYNDFILAENNYEARHEIMYNQIENVKKLWRGGSIIRNNGINEEEEVGIFPSPIQNELPIWVTAAGNEKTYEKAGEIGVNLLTHLLGQDIEDLSRKINIYREARKRHGHDEESGKVALMLHTYVGDDDEDIESVVKRPFIEYLRSATSLSKVLYQEAGYDPTEIPEEDKELMLEYSFSRYSKEAAMIGTVQECQNTVERISEIGVDEIACLIDFGIQQDKVLAGLNNLNILKESLINNE